MKIAYFDCLSGISGDMTVGAFLDAGFKFALLKKRLDALNIKGYEINVFKVNRNGISGTKFDVRITGKPAHKHTTPREIVKLITNSKLDNAVKALSISIFKTLAKAEAKIHNTRQGDARFHEVGNVDSIVDIVSTAIAVNELGIEKFYCLNLKLAQPGPAALEMLKGKPISFLDLGYELVTPTGAAILTTLVKDFKLRPDIEPEAIGYGAGTWNLKDTPNLLRVVIGNSKELKSTQDEIFVIQTNIDDMNPVSYEYLMGRLFKEGALDAYLTSVYMKKTRPGILLTVLTKEALLDKLAMLVMKETTSSGIRYYKVRRQKLDRQIKIAKTKYGSIRIKVNTGGGGIRTVSPEYEDCKILATKTGVPFKVIFEEANKKIG